MQSPNCKHGVSLKLNEKWVITLKDNNIPIGNISVNGIEKKHNYCNVGYVILYNYWGKGYATEGMKAFMDHAVKVYGARSFEGECARENVGSAMVMKKLGMVYDHSSSYSKNDGSATFESDVYVLNIDD